MKLSRALKLRYVMRTQGDGVYIGGAAFMAAREDRDFSRARKKERRRLYWGCCLVRTASFESANEPADWNIILYCFSGGL